MITTIAGTRILFLDLEDVQSRNNIVQTVCEAVKHSANPILPLGKTTEWDDQKASPWASRTVIYDEEERSFKCWYNGGCYADPTLSSTGYAVSDDGITWHKPRLGLFEYNGSKDNNICNLGIGCILKDAGEENPAKRYKMMLKGPKPQCGWLKGPQPQRVRINYSPDGIHWNEGPRINIPEIPLKDMVVLMRDDQDPDPQRRYKFVWQVKHPPKKPGPPKVRAKNIAFGPDIEHFTESKDNPILSPDDGLEDENHFLMLAPYAGMYVMPYEYGWYMPNGTGVFGVFSGDIRLAVSRDGEHFHRVQPHQKLISRGRQGEWDDGFIVISEKPVVRNDTIYMYYAGQSEHWTDWPLENLPADRQGSVPLGRWTSRMGLATLRLDGFTCLETTDRETPGHVTTKPIELSGRDVRLVLNVGDVRQGRSWIEVELLDAERDEPLEGFSRAECNDVHRDAVRVPVTWKKRALQQLEVSRFRLRFVLHGAARLYSFGFERSRNG